MISSSPRKRQRRRSQLGSSSRMVRSSLLRVLVLRFFGVLVFAGAGLVAIRLVAYGVGSPPGWLSSGFSSFSVWVSTPSAGGVDILVGAGLLLLAALAALTMVP